MTQYAGAGPRKFALWLEDSTDSGKKDMEFNNGLFEHFEDDFGSCQAWVFLPFLSNRVQWRKELRFSKKLENLYFENNISSILYVSY